MIRLTNQDLFQLHKLLISQILLGSAGEDEINEYIKISKKIYHYLHKELVK